MIAEREKNKVDFKWRTEARVDNIKIEMLPKLVKSGLEIIDLGLESASKIQIKNMGKSKKPEKYLEKASSFLQKCHEEGIKTKINIVLYAGENNETIEETKSWLRAHKDYIYGISACPILAFGWDKDKENYIKELLSLGASINKENSILGVTAFNLSENITYTESMKISREITQEFMNLDNYFYLKSFSYYPRNYSKEQFLDDNLKENDKKL